MDPRRPALRRHAQGAPRPPLRRRAADPHHRRPRAAGRRPRRRSARSSPTRTAPTPSLVSIEPATGYVRAMVGGRDFFGTGTDRQAQPGHPGPAGRPAPSFKPLVLATALEQGIDPLTTRISAPGVHHHPDAEREPGTPCNYGGGGGGTVTIAEGTVRSYNTLYAQLDACGSGPQAAMEMAPRARGSRSPLQPVPVRRARHQRRHGHGHGRRPTPPSPTAACTVPPCSSPGSPGPTAPSLYNHRAHARRRCSTPASPTTRHQHPRAGDRARHRHPGQARPARRRQDRHHRREQATPGSSATRRSWPPRCGSGSRARGRPEAVPMRPPTTPITVIGGSYPARDLAAVHERGAGRPARSSVPGPDHDHHHARAYVDPPPTTRRSARPAGARRRRASTSAEATADPARRPASCVARRAGADRAPSRRARSMVQSPAGGGRRPRGSTVTIEVADGKLGQPDAGLTRLAAGDRRRPDDRSRPTPRRDGRRWTPGVVVHRRRGAMVAMWVYVLYLAFGPGRQPPPDRLDRPRLRHRGAGDLRGRPRRRRPRCPRPSRPRRRRSGPTIVAQANAAVRRR